ncbi:MAG: RND transporter [Hyphomicrobium sp. 32-62-53]|nr:MAG: RND transporter [Hyphomicrobium sp. 12-62-95]OYY01658.1 MAG: RND transporter [Hyphomicrobium sp. 32-62-53]
MSILDKLPWTVVAILCLTLGLAPFTPEPHIVEKLRMLLAGTLQRPIDIFDLLFHATPWIVLGLKGLRAISR